MAALILQAFLSTGIKNNLINTLIIRPKMSMMIKRNFVRLISASCAVVILFSACRKRADISLPDNLIVFAASEQGISESENSIAVKLDLSRGTDRDVPVTINLTAEGLTYGTDFTTTPAAVAGVITL